MADKKTPDSRFVFLDLETTGLDPKVDKILEIGIIVTDKDLNEIARTSMLVYGLHPDLAVHARDIDLTIRDPFVRDMHTKNGIAEAFHKEQIYGTTWAEHEVIRFLRGRTGISMEAFAPGTATLAGSSIHFDRSFLVEHMPLLERMFDYRMVDVSTITGLLRRWIEPAETPDGPFGIDAYFKAQGESAHRALADCEQSIRTLKLYRDLVLRTDQMRTLVCEAAGQVKP